MCFKKLLLPPAAIQNSKKRGKKGKSDPFVRLNCCCHRRQFKIRKKNGGFGIEIYVIVFVVRHEIFVFTMTMTNAPLELIKESIDICENIEMCNIRQDIEVPRDNKMCRFDKFMESNGL